MKNCILLVCIITIMMPLTGLGQDSPKKNRIGAGVTYTPYMKNGIYFNDPFDFWPNQEKSAFPRIFYGRDLNEHLNLGAYLETGACRFTDQTGDSAHSFRRNIIGLEWTARYPNTRLHLELGGYFGYGYITANHWDNLKGADFGLLAGPAFESRFIGISVKMKAGFSPFVSDGIPEGVLLLTPGVLIEVFGKF